jgi:1-acyl-sn-glycerol-3-phosphate acyltransferase
MLPLIVISILLTYFFSQKALDPWFKKRMKLLFKILGIRVDSEGAEKIHPDRTYLFMANHVSIFDGPLLEAYIPAFVRGVEARRQFRWPLYGWAVRRLGNIPIDRKNIHSSIRSIRKTEGMLKDGRSIVILPEGHRTLDGQLNPFKKLPFFLAKQAEVEIIPIGMSGLFHLKRKGSWHIRPAPIKVKFGDVVPVEKVQSLDVVQLRDYIKEKIRGLIERP